MNITEHFSQRSAIYNKCGNWVNNNKILSAIMSYLPSNLSEVDIVDLGSGTGAVANYIANHNLDIHSLVAVDICSDMLSHIDNPKIKKIEASINNLPFEDNSFNAIVSRQCLHYIADLGNTTPEIFRILKPSGIFILSQIVPLDTSSKEYWDKIIKFRQPLRCNFLTEKEWIELFVQIGLNFLSVQRLATRGSINSWAKKYAITDTEIISKYKDLLINAPEQFKIEYNVQIEEDDISYDTFWFIAHFKK